MNHFGQITKPKANPVDQDYTEEESKETIKSSKRTLSEHYHNDDADESDEDRSHKRLKRTETKGTEARRIKKESADTMVAILRQMQHDQAITQANNLAKANNLAQANTQAQAMNADPADITSSTDSVCFGCQATFATQAEVFLHLPKCPRPHRSNPKHKEHFSKTGVTTNSERAKATDKANLEQVHETIVGDGPNADCRYCDKNMAAKTYWAKHVTHCASAYCVLCKTPKHSKFGCPTKLFCTICNRPGHFKGTHKFFN
jgi:hypothetical protein